MKLSIILRPFSDEKAVNKFIDMLSSSYGIEWQLIMQGIENECETEDESTACETADFSACSENISFVNCSEEEYLYQASRAAVYNQVIVASANDSYLFDIYAERVDSDICVINSEVYDDEERDFESKEDIAGGLLRHSFPLSRCVIKTDLLRSKVRQNAVWDSVYENLLVSELLSATESAEISQNVYLRDYKSVRASYTADSILTHSELINSILLTADKERIFYMISDFFIPIFRDAEKGKISRRSFEYIKSFANALLTDESGKRLLDAAVGYDICESLQSGYHYFAAFAAQRASVEDKKLQSIQKKLTAQTKKTDSIDKTVKAVLKRLDALRSAQEALDKSIKALDRKTQNMNKSVNACKSVLKRPDMLMLSDNIFYLSETLAALYEQCKSIDLMPEERKKENEQ